MKTLAICSILLAHCAFAGTALASEKQSEKPGRGFNPLTGNKRPCTSIIIKVPDDLINEANTSVVGTGESTDDRYARYSPSQSENCANKLKPGTLLGDYQADFPSQFETVSRVGRTTVEVTLDPKSARNFEKYCAQYAAECKDFKSRTQSKANLYAAFVEFPTLKLKEILIREPARPERLHFNPDILIKPEFGWNPLVNPSIDFGGGLIRGPRPIVRP